MLKVKRRCPFCGGKLLYSEMVKEIKQPETVQCVGECCLEIMNDDYKKPTQLIKYVISSKETSCPERE